MKHCISIIVILSILSLLACNQQKSGCVDEEEFLQMLDDVDNGLVSQKQVGNLIIKIKYLPTDYMVSREFSSGETNTDSIYDIYKSSLYFFLTYSYDDTEGSGADISLVGLSNYQEFTERVYYFNFSLNEEITLQIEEEKLSATACIIESTQGLDKDIRFLIMFSPTTNKDQLSNYKGDLDIVLHDIVYQSGIHHFRFTRQSIDDFPRLNIMCNKEK
jgi:hypothetical protein